MRKIKFSKMHGAGNDFVVIDDRECVFPADDHILLSALAAPRTGIACEGVILIRNPEKTGDFRMLFFNPDGTAADLCGNGARCAAAFAKECGAAKGRSMSMETGAGLVDAEIESPGTVKVWMNEPHSRRYNLELDIDGVKTVCHHVVAGVPHVVVEVPDISSVDVERIGRKIRRHAEFLPDGANVDFVQYCSPQSLLIRTYERGVEGESGACGTGAVAAAVVGVEVKSLMLPMRVRTAGGFDLLVDGDWRRSKSTGFTLTGPVATVFTGEIDIDNLYTGGEME